MTYHTLVVVNWFEADAMNPFTEATLTEGLLDVGATLVHARLVDEGVEHLIEADGATIPDIIRVYTAVGLTTKEVNDVSKAVDGSTTQD